MMRKIYWAIPLAIILCVACQKQQPATSDSQPEPSAAQTAQIPSETANSNDSEIILSSGDFRLTLQNYKTCIAVHDFLGQNVSKRILANSRFQRDEVQRCLQIAVMKQYAQKNQVSISPADRQKSLKMAFERNAVQSEEALRQKLGISEQQLDEIIASLNLQNAIQKDLLKKLPKDDAQKMFSLDWTKMSLELAQFDNQPNDDEVAHFWSTNQEAISNYLGAHQELLNTSPLAEFVRLAYDGETAREQAGQLRELASRDGMKAAIEKCQTDAEAGCKILNDEDHLHAVERTDEYAWAFRIPVGAVSEIIQQQEQQEIWILSHVRSPQVRNMKDPNTIMFLGTQIMKDTVAAPHILADLKTDLEADNLDFKAVTLKYGGKFGELSDVTFAELSDKKLISSQKVLDALAELRPEHAMLFSNPIVENSRIYVFRVTQLSVPSEADFERSQADWLLQKMNGNSLKLAEEWIMDNMPHMTTLNIRPIQKEYGILQPDGSIR